MKSEINPSSWFRFGNVINTSDCVSIYCIELSTFPETHMLTKFKIDAFSEIPKTIKNMGWKYEKVQNWKRSGSISKIETENYIINLDEEKRVNAPDILYFVDNTPEHEAEGENVWPVVRSEYSDVYRYLKGKKLEAGISIPPECIPECTMCKNDTKKVSVKVNSGIRKVDIEPDCCRSCIWWEWFHTIRKNMVECKCADGCDCGRLKYKKKETVVAKMEDLEIKSKSTAKLKK